MYCSKCGQQNSDDARYCSRCGSPLIEPENTAGYTGSGSYDQPPFFEGERPGQQRDPNLVYPSQCLVSPGLAVLTSLFFCGLGQLLSGQYAKGFLLFLGNLLLAWLFNSLLLNMIFQIVATVDAYQSAKTLRFGTPIGKFSFFGQP